MYKGILVVDAYYDKIKNFTSLDAERHRRTPRLSAISGETIRVRIAGLLALANSMRDAGIQILSKF